MKILAVDYGDSRTGLATCDHTEFLTTPITPQITLKARNKVAARVCEVAKEIEAELIVVALGQNIDNELGLPVERNEVVAEGTSVDGKVFVAGDIAKGDKTVVAAVNKGKLAAYEIHNRIGG